MEQEVHILKICTTLMEFQSDHYAFSNFPYHLFIIQRKKKSLKPITTKNSIKYFRNLILNKIHPDMRKY